MRRFGLLTLVLLGCAAKPAPPPTASTAPATASEPRLGRVAEATPPPPPESEPEAPPPTVLPSISPLPELATFEAPPVYRVRVTTTEGEFIVIVDRNLAPNAANRFYNLVLLGYYRDTTFFRVIPNFMTQFGIHGDPEVNAAWREATIPSDPVHASNLRGTIVFANAGPDTATTQLFINLVDNPNLDSMGFAPFGEVVDGMNVVDTIYAGYGEGAPRGQGPSQSEMQARGEAYLADFPQLTRIIDMSLM